MEEFDIKSIADRLATILTEHFDVRVGAAPIDGDSALREDLGLDSVAIVELIGAIEAEFGLEFRDSDFRGSVFATVGTLAGVVASRLRE